jgi:replicative DNA helicase
MSGDFERVPPHDVKAEQCVLGGMMLSKDAIADVAEEMRPDDHCRPAHRLIHEAILELDGAGKPADAITVADWLTAAGLISKTGGAPYLHTCINQVPAAANAGYYARIVRKYAALNGLIQAGIRIEQYGWAADVDADEIPQRIEAAYRALDEATGNAAPAQARSIAVLAGPALDRMEKGPDAGARGVTTGWADLDELIPGFQPGEMVTVGSRPGVGKSVILLNVAVHAAVRLAVPVLVASLEMSEQECIDRIIAAEATADLQRIRTASLDDADWTRIAGAHERLAGASLMLNTSPYQSVQTMRSDLRSMRRAGTPAGLLVVDYLQLMTSGGKPENRQAEVSEISRGIKLLGKEFGIPVLVGSQLNRGPEMRSDRRPLLADLRESGSVEQDSSIVILLYREDTYERESPRAGEIDLIVAKNRQGRQATVTLAFRGHHAKCSDMYRPWTPAAALGSAA